MSKLFQTKEYQTIFAEHHLDGFASLWAKEIDWFEPPNHRRGGWSGVGQMMLTSDLRELSVFVKKQQNHGRRTLWHPFSGEPTFRREFKRLIFLEQQQIKAPKVVLYAEEKVKNDVCAILATETLLGFEPLDIITRRWHKGESVTRLQKTKLLQSVAETVRRFHQAGLVHRALYPKHIFVKNAETVPEVAFIDLEKSRFSLFFLYRAYFDLSALNRHAEYWSRSQRLRFFLSYMQSKRLTKRLKFMCQLILRRSTRS
jgi:hypothetical protein